MSIFMTNAGGGGGSAFRVPTIQKFLSGSGTYTAPTPTPLYIRVEMVGGGGGGGGSGSSGGGTGGTGGNSTFGTTLLSANGGTGGSATGIAGSGGSSSLGSGPIGIAISGGNGGGVGFGSAQLGDAGGMGGVTPFGGGGAGGAEGTAGSGASANSGSGGGGAGVTNVVSANAGCGGGAGGYVNALISPVGTTFAYAVGIAGTGGAAGTAGQAGGPGGAGLIVVTEYYQNVNLSAPIPVSMSMRYTGTVSTISGSSQTITFNTLDYDTNGIYSGGVATIPSGGGGKWLIHMILNSTCTASAFQTFQISFLKDNATTTSLYNQAITAADSTFNVMAELSDVLNLVPGDTIQAQALNTGTTPTITNVANKAFFSMTRIGL
jgi:hypothetical protein